MNSGRKMMKKQIKKSFNFRNSVLRTLATGLALAALSPTHAFAANVYWVDDSFGNWSNGQWSSTPGGPPNSFPAYPVLGDDVFIINSSAINKRIRYASFIPNEQIRSIELDATGSGNMTMDMGDFGHTLNTVFFTIGVNGQAVFTQKADFHKVGADLTLGSQSGSTGTYNLLGGTLNVLVDMKVGDLGTGIFSVGAGGTAKIDDSFNSAILAVNNAGSSISTGNTSTAVGGYIEVRGRLKITNGATATSYRGVVDFASNRFTDNNITSRTVAEVTGTDSRWDTAFFYVGWDSIGDAVVSNGGEVISRLDTFIGTNANSIGTLSIAAAGRVDTQRDGYLARFAGSKGAVVVEGNNAVWDIGTSLYVGGIANASGGTGTLTVNGGGTVNVGTDLTVWNANSSITTGTTGTILGGQINAGSALTLIGGGKATSYFGVVDDATFNLANSIEASTANITGTGSNWDTRIFYSGRTGTGTTTVSNNGRVSSVLDTYVGLLSGSNGTLEITTGAVVDTNRHGYIATLSSSSGSVAVGAPGALWDVANGLYVGGSGSTSGGTGTLTVNNGGTVNVGTDLTVWNANSSITTGSTGTTAGGQINAGGVLTLTGGGQATSYYGVVDDAAFNFANSIEASTANITGTDSNWDTRIFYSGRTGTGTTTVSNGGKVSSVLDTYVGLVSGSDGTLNITAGGMVDTNRHGYIANLNGSSGSVTVGGTGALWDVANDLYVGGSAFGSGGTGTLTVNAGGTVNVGSDLTVWNNGTVNVAGGALNTTNIQTSGNGLLNITEGVVSTNGAAAVFNLQGRTTLGVAGALIADGGTVNLGGTVSNGGALIATNNGTINLSNSGITNNAVTKATAGGLVTIANGATLKGGLIEAVGVGSRIDVQVGGTIASQAFVETTILARNGANLNVDGIVNGSVSVFNGGSLTGSGTIMADVTNTNGGFFNAGNSPGMLSITGDYTQDAFSTLIFELGGTVQGTAYDWVDVGGTAFLGGTLEVSWFDLGSGLFGAALGDSFDLLTAETLTGKFDLLTLAVLGNGLDWDLSYLTDEIGTTDVLRLSVVSAVPIPAAVWLFGSGLIGLIGVARRKQA